MDLSSCLFSLLCLSTVLAELQLAVVSPKTAILGSDTLLKCTFTVGTSRVDFQYLAITWSFKGRELLRYKDRLYVFDSRVSIDEAKIADGNASLKLSELRLSHEGEYTCSVIYSPDRREKTITLILQARPRIIIQEPAVIKGKENLLRCSVVGFYPMEISVFWSRDGQILPGSSMSQHQRHTNGTFMINSTLPITPTDSDANHTFSCHVRHSSLEGPLRKDLMLVFQAHPRIIIQDPILIKGKENLLRCSVVGFYPMEISVFWAKDGQLLPGSSMSQRQTYANGTFMVNCTLPIIPTDSEVNHNFSCRVYHSSLVGPLEKDVVLVLQEEEKSVSIMVVVLPLVGIVVVIVAVLGWFLYRRLANRESILCEIQGPETWTIGETAELVCVGHYWPNDIKITWIKLHKGKETEIEARTSPTQDNMQPLLSMNRYRAESRKAGDWGGSLTFTSTLFITPSLEEDEGAVFKCRFFTSDHKIKEEKEFKDFKLYGEPKVNALKVKSFRKNEIRTLLLDVYGFYPGKVTVWWTYDTQGERTGLPSTLNVTKEGDGTYSAQSTCHLTRKDGKKIGETPTVTLTIEHEALREPLTLTVTLKNKGNDWTLVSQNFSWAPKNPLPHTIKDNSQAQQLQGDGWPWLPKDAYSRAMAH